MNVSITKGATTWTLAGDDGAYSETSNLSIVCEGQFQQVAYIEADQFRQFFRGGSSVTISFDSVRTFSTLALAEAYLLDTPQALINQSGVTAKIGRSGAEKNLSDVSVIINLSQQGVTIRRNVTLIGKYT
jgi:hypothetical protein